MARHAGFGAVVSLRQAEVNRRIRQAFANVGPFFFPLPQTITVGTTTVEFGGYLQVAAPTVEFHDNPDGVVNLHFAFIGTFSARVGTDNLRRWRVRLDAALSVGFTLEPKNQQIVLGLNTPSFTLQPLVLTPLTTPSPPQLVVQALQSQALADAATAFVNSLPPLDITAVMPARFFHMEPLDIDETNTHLFNWFNVTLEVNRTVLRVMEGTITVAADFAGITQGNPDDLVDLTRTRGDGDCYEWTVPSATGPGAVPVLSSRGYFNTYSVNVDEAVSVNFAVLKNIVNDQISPQIASTQLAKKDVRLWKISLDYAQFDPPLQPYPQRGLHFSLIVSALGVLSTIDIYLQPFLLQVDYPLRQAWQLSVTRVDVNYMGGTGAILFVAEALGAVFGVTVAFQGVANAFNQADPENIANTVQKVVQGATWAMPLPVGRYIAISTEAIDLGWGLGKPDTSILPVEPKDGGAVIQPQRWSVYDRKPIETSVALTGNWQKLQRNDLRAFWEIRRADTNAVAATGSRPFAAPNGNGVKFDFTSKDLYAVSDYVARCTLSLTRGGRAGEIWSGTQTIHIDDDFDRSRPFVEWGPFMTHFYGANHEWWERISRSRIHRTAVAARCLMLRQVAPTTKDYFDYRDDLPFPWADLNKRRRRILCDYCFFGGPDKTKPYPRDNWFKAEDVFSPTGVHIVNLGP